MQKVILLLVLVAVAFSYGITTDYECPHDKEVQCIDDVNKAFDICEKAAAEKGKDIPVDLDCMKYFAQMGEDCWDCVCWIAQVQQVTVFGC